MSTAAHGSAVIAASGLVCNLVHDHSIIVHHLYIVSNSIATYGVAAAGPLLARKARHVEFHRVLADVHVCTFLSVVWQ